MKHFNRKSGIIGVHICITKITNPGRLECFIAKVVHPIAANIPSNKIAYEICTENFH